jgi:hypothetical protein
MELFGMIPELKYNILSIVALKKSHKKKGDRTSIDKYKLIHHKSNSRAFIKEIR